MAVRINEKLELLQKVRAEAVKGEQAMKASISMISHDMRTPLTSVIGYLQLAQKNCEEKDILQEITVALDRARYCNRLVNDFFDLSVLDLNQCNPVMEKTDICDVVCEEILGSYMQFEENGITPVFEQANDVIWVWADKKLLIRVIQNLISNGIKYSTGKMNFSIARGDKIVLSISSSISKKVDADKIFEKYYRDANVKKGEGSGLGLYICRRLVEQMNGEISAYSTESVLTVRVELLQ